MCFNPIFAWKTRAVYPKTGKPVYTNKPCEAVNIHDPITWPCNKCIGCYARRAQEWGIRSSHEAHMNETNSFITLTYNPHKLPSDNALDPAHLQLFIKRLRKQLKFQIKYEACGEYGPNGTHRPHYHLCLFGYDFPDKKIMGMSKKGHPFCKSKQLNEIWGMGKTSVQDFTYETATYVSKYTHKFNIHNRARVDLAQGRTEEFSRHSKGLGLSFFHKFMSDMYPCDEVTIKGSKGFYKVKPPRYYDKKYEELFPDELKIIKKKRSQEAWKHREDSTLARLQVREEIKLLGLRESPRDIS